MMRMVFALLVITAMATGCATTTNHMPPRPALINHAVFIKLLDPADTDELLADCNELLATIPGVVSYYAGKHHSIGRDSPTIFSDYSVGLFVGFDSDEDYAVYVDHPNHVAAVEKWRPRWEWIRVYDVLDESR
jgi:hypothetical protein